MEDGRLYNHGESLKLLSPAEKFVVDLGNLLQDLAGSMVVGNEPCNRIVRLLWYVIHLRSQPRVADRKIVLGTMTRPVGALASRFATSFVALDEGAAEDRFERRQFAQQSVAAFP